MSFGERLQAVRRESGETQEEFAEHLKVSRQAVSKWESSKGYPEIEKILYICNRYGVTMDALFADELPAGAPGELPAEAEVFRDRPLKKVLADFASNLSFTHKCLIGGLLAAAALLVLLTSHHLKGGSDQVMTIVWAAAIVLFGIVEAVTAGLVSLWFVAGALAALVAAFVGAPVWLQIVLFLAVSAVALSLTRPLLKKLNATHTEATNADRVLSQIALVTEEIDNIAETGQVKLFGQVWSARSESGEIIPVQSRVRILRIEGVKVFVRLV
jgi:membrane protein implicated in regulation of membrane protease activity/transcriptional regulator with XRE-family HTH domain